MYVEQYIEDQFAHAGLSVQSIRLLPRIEKSFGDFLAEVSTNLGLFRVERERGHYFVDGYDEASERFVRGSARWPDFVSIYARNAWELGDLLEIVRAQGGMVSDGP
ncbi:hypothetical protein [Dyella sedimenti]|jgi:hypothetical protein|uniref:hypothetical protein n=1 Tax=Dyella sedimenti TaxID=2919947 RepID=UPI001FAA2518|nr:hypothetical protein [Dyella sedimenti]